MQRTLQVSGKTRTIHTVNGIDTKTDATYIKDLKPYDSPLPNGYNVELGEDIWDRITLTPALWDQGSWRNVFDLSDVDEEMHFASLEILNVPKSKAKCGTAMCAAGWAAELGGADWVQDAKAIQTGSASFAESVLVPKAQWEATMTAHSELAWETAGPDGWTQFDDHLTERLAKRGFTHTTHVVISARTYALMRLGLDHDYLEMFSANNDYPRIRACLDTYTKYGNLTHQDGGFQAEEAQAHCYELCVGYREEMTEYGEPVEWALDARPASEREQADA